MGDLRYASPATVSRAGMVYVDPKNLGYTPYWNKFLLKIDIKYRDVLNLLFEKYVPSILDRIFEGNVGFEKFTPLELVVFQTKLNMVFTVYIILL